MIHDFPNLPHGPVNHHLGVDPLVQVAPFARAEQAQVVIMVPAAMPDQFAQEIGMPQNLVAVQAFRRPDYRLYARRQDLRHPFIRVKHQCPFRSDLGQRPVALRRSVLIFVDDDMVRIPAGEGRHRFRRPRVHHAEHIIGPGNAFQAFGQTVARRRHQRQYGDILHQTDSLWVYVSNVRAAMTGPGFQ